jgi:hypothetical protein
MTESTPPEPGPEAGISDLEADIEHTRRELADTVDALTAKLDVKEQARQKVADTKETVVHKADTIRHTATDNPQRTVPVVAALLLGALAVGFVVWRRRR